MLILAFVGVKIHIIIIIIIVIIIIIISSSSSSSSSSSIIIAVELYLPAICKVSITGTLKLAVVTEVSLTHFLKKLAYLMHVN